MYVSRSRKLQMGPKEKDITHEGPAHVTRGGHLHRPAHARERRLCCGGVPFADDVDCRATRPSRGGARVVRDAERQWDDSHHFV